MKKNCQNNHNIDIPISFQKFQLTIKLSYLFMLIIQLLYFDCKKVLHPKKSKMRPESEMCSHSRLIRSSLLKI